MADFATWATAAEPLGWQPGTFLRAYLSNRGEANSLAVEMAVLGPAVIGMMSLQAEWCGTAHELLTQLNAHHSDEQTRRRRDWPTSERKLAGDLRRLAPNLRRIGIEIVFGERAPGSGRRLIVIRKSPDSTVTTVSSSHAPSVRSSKGPHDVKNEVTSDTKAIEGVTACDDRQATVTVASSPQTLDLTRCDGSDGLSMKQSDLQEEVEWTA